MENEVIEQVTYRDEDYVELCDNMINFIDIALARGAVQGNELTHVAMLRNSIVVIGKTHIDNVKGSKDV